MTPGEEETIPTAIQNFLAALENRNHYEVLGIAPGDEPREAFHRFSERFHPDMHPRATDEFLRALRRIYQAGAEAYRILRNPTLRAQYDLDLAKAKESGSRKAESLEDLCSTKGGKLHARQAERALTAGSLREAKDLLRKALLAEGQNPRLSERLEAVESLLFLSGQ